MLVVLLAVAAVVANHVIQSRLPQYRDQAAQQLGEAIDANVSIRALKLRWRWTGPVLRLTGVHVTQHNKQHTQIDVPAIGLQFSLLDLASGKRLPERVVVHRPRIGIALKAQSWPQMLHKLLQLPPPDIDWESLERARKVLDSVVIDNARIHATLKADSGPRHLRLSRISATMDNSANRLIISAAVRPNRWFKGLQVKADINGSLPDFDGARVKVNARSLAPLALWQTLIDTYAPSRLSGGATSIRLDSQWRGHHLQRGRLRLDVQQLRNTSTARVLLPAFSAQLQAHADPDNSNMVDVALASLSGDASQLKAIDASATFDTAQSALTLHVRDIAAELFAPLLQQLSPELAKAQLGGSIDSADVKWAPDTPLQATMAFANMQIKAPTFAIGAISGQYKRRSGNNILHFTKARGKARMQRYLKGELPISNLVGELHVARGNHTITLRADGLKLTSGTSTMQLDGSLSLPASGVPVANVTSTVKTADCPALLSHVPQAQDMPFDKLRAWLPRAIKACDVTVKGFMKGPVDEIFADNGKHFGLTMTGSGYTMAYKPGWPELSDATGSIDLKGKTMDIDIRRGKVLGVDVGPVKLHIPSVVDPILTLDGSVSNGSAPQMLSFLAKSPLRDDFGKLTTALDVKGKAGLDLHALLPLRDDLGDIKVSGTIHADNDSVDHEALPAPLKSVTGDIHFDTDGLSAKKLKGTLLGVPVTTRITPASANSIDIVTRGRIRLPEDKALLTHYMPERWLTFAHGSAQVKASLQVDRTGHASGISLYSDLKGLALTLPAPLHKQASNRTDLNIHIKDGGHVKLAYGNVLDAVMAFKDDDLQAASIHLGAGPETLTTPANHGIRLSGKLTTLRAGAWIRALRQLYAGHNDDAEADMPGRTAPPLVGADMHFGTVQFDTRTLRDIHINAKPIASGQGLHIQMDGRDATGTATWHNTDDGRGKVQAHLSHLRIGTAPAKPTTSHANDGSKSSSDGDSADNTTATFLDTNPRRLPGLDITVDTLQVADTNFGTAKLLATRTDKGWQLRKATLTGGALQVHADGHWQRHVGLTEAQLSTHIEGHGVARLTQALGFKPAINAKHVTIQGSLQVAPNDHGLSPAALNGKLALKLDDGVIKSIDPGAGRLLGLLNLYVLPRRLELGFKDVTDPGLAFGKITGNFNIMRGNAFTKNLDIRTPSSEIKVVGRVGLAARDYDQTVTITPQIGSSVALAGTVLGGPVVGAAVFALQQLLEKPLQNASSITYELKGSWGNPQVVNPHADSKGS